MKEIICIIGSFCASLSIEKSVKVLTKTGKFVPDLVYAIGAGVVGGMAYDSAYEHIEKTYDEVTSYIEKARKDQEEYETWKTRENKDLN